MAYWMLQNDRASYAVDWDIIHRLVRGYHRANLRDTHSRVVTTSDSTWFNPFSWSLPDIRSMEVDWDKVSTQSSTAADDDFNRLAELGTRDVRGMHRDLKWMVSDTSRRTTAFTDKLGALQTENMSRISSAVDSYGGQIEAAKFVRDTAADGLMVGATIITGGGAGVAILGSGSALKGWAKYQDTDNLSEDRRLGSAFATGVGNFVFGAFKLGGRTLSVGEEAVVVIMQAKWETGVALAEGKSIGQALATGSLKLAGPFVDRVFKLLPVKTMIERACVPIVITIATKNDGIENVASTMASKWLGKVAQKQGVERGGKAAIKALSGSSSTPAAEALRHSEVIANATLSDHQLLTLAIVNMTKGIGQGL